MTAGQSHRNLLPRHLSSSPNSMLATAPRDRLLPAIIFVMRIATTAAVDSATMTLPTDTKAAAAVVEVTAHGSPDMIILRARVADMRASAESAAAVAVARTATPSASAPTCHNQSTQSSVVFYIM